MRPSGAGKLLIVGNGERKWETLEAFERKRSGAVEEIS